MFEGQIEEGAMLKAPVLEPHKRGKNWMAKIDLDPRSPGGLSREFIKRGNGDYLYLTDELGVGDVVEFGADYYSGMGKKNPKRWYGIIRKVDDAEILIQEYTTARAAIMESRRERDVQREA